ncbi:MAG: phosphate ABC transporter permease PstA [bacterium]
MTTKGKRSRHMEEIFFRLLMMLSTVLVVGVLVLILGMVAVKGVSYLSLEMLTQSPKGGFYLGKGGGILNAIVGSLCVGLGATALALVVSLPVVIYVNVFSDRTSLIARCTRFTMDLMWGVPSIVYGAFGFILMLCFGMRASLGAAIITVALLELPVMIRAMDEVMRMVPAEIKEASYCLGATRLETAFKVVLRQAAPGLITAVLIAFGRGIGDTAAVLFTAGFTDRIPTSLADPAATLPLAIFFQLGTPYPEVQGRAYAAAAVLTLIIMTVSIASRLVSKFYSRNIVR